MCFERFPCSLSCDGSLRLFQSQTSSTLPLSKAVSTPFACEFPRRRQAFGFPFESGNNRVALERLTLYDSCNFGKTRIFLGPQDGPVHFGPLYAVSSAFQEKKLLREEWIMSGKFCQECGTELIDRELENEGIIPFCPKCGQYRFPMYNVAVSMIVINKRTHKILLIKQYGKPFYILVAGYVNRTEALEHAVVREVKEETGLTVSRVKFNRTRFFEPSNTLMCNFTAFVEDDKDFCVNGEVDDYQWFSSDEARENILRNSFASHFLNAYLDEERTV